MTMRIGLTDAISRQDWLNPAEETLQKSYIAHLNLQAKPVRALRMPCTAPGLVTLYT